MVNYFQCDLSVAQVNAIPNLALAHVGDGAYELMCRTYLCLRGDKTVLKLHTDTVELVKAPTQAKFADKLKPILTEEERNRRTEEVKKALASNSAYHI